MLHEYSCLFHADFRSMRIIGNMKIISGGGGKKKIWVIITIINQSILVGEKAVECTGQM